MAFEVSSGGGGGGSNTTPIENLIDNQAAASQFTSVTVTAWADYDVLIFVGHDDSASRDIQCFVSTLALEEDGRANCGISNNDVALSVTDTNTLSFNRGNAGTGDTVSVWSMDVGVGPAGADGATGATGDGTGRRRRRQRRARHPGVDGGHVAERQLRVRH